MVNEIDNNAMTLTDYALHSNDPLIQEVAMSMIKAGSIFQDLPVITNPSLKVTGGRIVGGLPDVPWSPINGEPTIVKTEPKHYEEAFYFWREGLDFDEYLLQDKNAIDNPINIQSKALIDAKAYQLNDMLINNAHRTLPGRNRTADPNGFVGFRERLDNPVYGLNIADCNKTAGGLDMSDGSISDNNANKLIRMMQSVLDAMGANEGEGVVIYMNDDLIARIEFGIRELGAGGGFDITKDAFDRSIMTYRNAKVRRIGRKAPDSSGNQPYIITSTETQDGSKDSTGDCTSMYFAKYGRDSLYGWQFHAPRLDPKFNLDNGVIERVIFKGGYGINTPNTRAIGRLHGIKVA